MLLGLIVSSRPRGMALGALPHEPLLQLEVELVLNDCAFSSRAQGRCDPPSVLPQLRVGAYILVKALDDVAEFFQASFRAFSVLLHRVHRRSQTLLSTMIPVEASTRAIPARW